MTRICSLLILSLLVFGVHAQNIVSGTIWPENMPEAERKLTFHSQGNYILPVPGKKDAFIFMDDRWLPTPQSVRSDGRYIWLPVQFENGLPVLKWMDNWTLDFL